MDALPSNLHSCVLEDVTLEEEIGRGAHGRVLAATWEGTPVAVKHIHTLFNDVASDFEYQKLRENFLKECERSSQIRHPNIVRFLGICLSEGDHIPRLVMERLSSNLDQLLMKHPVIPEGIKYNILHGVSLGIRFLHTRRPAPIIHRDLSSKNVLVSSAMEGKIGDLGTARFVDERRQSQMTRAPGTADFMPPEVLTDKPAYSISVDLFSFGCVMLHTLGHEWPTPKQAVVGYKETNTLIARSEMERRGDYMEKLISRPGGIPDEMKGLISQCLSNYPDDRPKIKTVNDRLGSMKSQYMPTLSLTVLDAQVLLEQTRKNFEDAYNKMGEVHSFLFQSPKTPVRSQASKPPSSSQLPTGLPGVSEVYSSRGLTGQPRIVPVTTGVTGPALTGLPDVTTTNTATPVSQSLNTALVPKERLFFDQHSRSVPDDTDGSPIKSKPIFPKEKPPSESGALENHDQLGSKESVVVKEKDEVFIVSSDEAKQLDGQADKATHLATAVSIATSVMTTDNSPAAAKKAMPKTEPRPPLTSVVPPTSTADAGNISQLPVAKQSAMTAPVDAIPDSVKRTKKIIPQLESKYVPLLDNLPEDFESSLGRLQQIFSDEQICDILSIQEPRASNQKILNCLIERVTCEEDVLDLCSNLDKIMGSQALASIVEELRKDIMESLQAKSSNGTQRSSSNTDKLWPRAGNRDHMTYSQMASACLATKGHASSHPCTIEQELTGEWKGYKMKWDKLDDMTDKCMSTSVVELDGKVYAVLESTAARFLNVRMYSCEANAWTSLPPLQYGGASLATIPSRNQLLAIGGIYHPDVSCSNISKKAYLWDEKYETWLTVYPDMLTPRCYCCSIGYKSMVIVAGGTTQYEGNRNTEAVEILKAHDTNPRESQWIAVRSMPTLMYQYMVPVLIDDTLYIASGFRKGLPISGFNIVSANVPALLKSTNHDAHPVWNRLPELPHSSFSISHFDGHLVAFGGEELDTTANRRLDGRHRLCTVTSIHVYKSFTHEWEKVGEVPHAYSLGCAVRLQENKIMFVGALIDPSCVTDKDLLTTCPVVTITK